MDTNKHLEELKERMRDMGVTEDLEPTEEDRKNYNPNKTKELEDRIKELENENKELKSKQKEKSYSDNPSDWMGCKEATPHVTPKEGYGYKETMPWNLEKEKNPWEGMK